MLDTLARQIHPGATGFAEVHRRFSASVKAFYPQSAKHQIARNLPRGLARVLAGLKRRLLG